MALAHRVTDILDLVAHLLNTPIPSLSALNRGVCHHRPATLIDFDVQKESVHRPPRVEFCIEKAKVRGIDDHQPSFSFRCSRWGQVSFFDMRRRAVHSAPSATTSICCASREPTCPDGCFQSESESIFQLRDRRRPRCHCRISAWRHARTSRPPPLGGDAFQTRCCPFPINASAHLRFQARDDKVVQRTHPMLPREFQRHSTAARSGSSWPLRHHHARPAWNTTINFFGRFPSSRHLHFYSSSR